MAQKVHLLRPFAGYVGDGGTCKECVEPGPGTFPLVDNISDSYGHFLIIAREDGENITLPEPDTYDLFIFDDERESLALALARHKAMVQYAKDAEYAVAMQALATEALETVRGLLRYSLRDISSLAELTAEEQEIIGKEEIFRFLIKWSSEGSAGN